jgi:23S rRNA (uracil1939-C5)-methyltransferase
MRVTIEKLVYGGDGLARTDQGVVFVPRTAPGDVADVEIIERKPDYAHARVTTLVEPSPDRQTPYCPNYESAGCCHWQHIRYPRQLEIKESILRETLRRTARIPWEEPIRTVSGADRNYRMRAAFHVRDRKLGFVEEGGHAVVPIAECASLTPELNAFIPQANEILAGPEMAGVREVDAISGPPVLAAFGHRRIGAGPVRINAGGFVFDLHPEAFFQSNRYLLSDFITEVADAAAGVEHLLDLFCGSGFFTIPLSRKVREVLGVEWSHVGVEQARLNARLNNVTNVEFHEGEVAATLERSQSLRPDMVMLNPPRTGCSRTVAEQIANLGADRLLYVSCNPTTFAREAAIFVKHGYILKRLTMVDQFPNTYHIEMIAAFER